MNAVAIPQAVKRFRNSKTKRRLRCALYRRQIMRGATRIHCHYCGTTLTPMTATIDHMVPLARGGTWQVENLVLACSHCNALKGHKPYAVFLRQAQRIAA